MAETEQLNAEAVVIGAGVVGLAVARVLARQGREVLVLEAEDRFGEGISSRNSEVIHAGLYYPEASFKARLCIAGRQQLYGYCQSRSIPHRKTGKWIIASDHSQAPALAAIEAQARTNGVRLQTVEGRALAAALPDVRAVAALYSPETGIVDSHALMLALLADLEAAGGQLVCRAPVQSVSSDERGHRLEVGGELPCELTATQVVNATGLGAAALAGRWQGLPAGYSPQLRFARGVYFSYSGRHPFTSLIYPVPEPGGLGVHLTLDMAGQARFGPDVEWVETPDFHVDPARRSSFATAIRQWWPGLDESRLIPAYAGVRPKLGGPEAGFLDFRIDGPQQHGLPGLVQLFGIESPGLTACLAIADQVAACLDDSSLAG